MKASRYSTEESDNNDITTRGVNGPYYYLQARYGNIVSQELKIQALGNAKLVAVDINARSATNLFSEELFISAYPNPVSDILNIEIKDETIVAIKAQAAIQNKTINTDFDIHLYDGFGNIQRKATAKGGKVEFNVTNLPNGFYYLHIYDGVNEKPEMRQIVVKH